MDMNQQRKGTTKGSKLVHKLFNTQAHQQLAKVFKPNLTINNNKCNLWLRILISLI